LAIKFRLQFNLNNEVMFIQNEKKINIRMK